MTRMTRFFRNAIQGATLLVLFGRADELRAQPTEQTVPGRFLFIFDTSRNMKSRLDATQLALETMLATSCDGQLHRGDSMAFWTFNQQLRPGDHPLMNWNPDQAVALASNVVKFVETQHYTKKTRFEALQPVLNAVVQDSGRLTIFIFCDGETKFTGTPFDAGVNELFKQRLAAQKKASQPFVVALRSQLGKYVGCAVNTPPDPMVYPQFPPLPAPPVPPPAPKPVQLPASVKIITNAPLIIVGNKEPGNPPPSTNPPPAASVPGSLPAPTPQAVSAAAAPPVVAAQGTSNEPAATSATSNYAPAAPPPTPPPSKQTKSSEGNMFVIIGAGLGGAAVALAAVFWLRPRPKDPSLISRSLNDRK